MNGTAELVVMIRLERNWSVRESLKFVEENIPSENLVEAKNDLLLLADLKVDLIKQFVYALPKNRTCLVNLCRKFPVV